MIFFFFFKFLILSWRIGWAGLPGFLSGPHSHGVAPLPVELQLTLCLLTPSFCAIWAGFSSPAPHAIFWPALTGFFGLVPVSCDSCSGWFPCAIALSRECMNRLHPNKQVFPWAAFFKAAQTRPPVSRGVLCTSTFCFLHA